MKYVIHTDRKQFSDKGSGVKISKPGYATEGMAMARLQQAASRNSAFLQNLVERAPLASAGAEQVELALENMNQQYEQLLASLPGDDFAAAYNAYQKHPMLRNPLWQNQLELKQQQRETVIQGYQLKTAEQLAKWFKDWHVAKPAEALAKKAQRHRVLKLDLDGEAYYPMEQFEFKTKSPTVLPALLPLLRELKAAQISHEELLYWLITAQQLPDIPALRQNMALTKQLNSAIHQSDDNAAWQALQQAGPSTAQYIRPLDLALADQQEALMHLFGQWYSKAQRSDYQQRLQQARAIVQSLGVDPHEIAADPQPAITQFAQEQ